MEEQGNLNQHTLKQDNSINDEQQQQISIGSELKQNQNGEVIIQEENPQNDKIEVEEEKEKIKTQNNNEKQENDENNKNRNQIKFADEVKINDETVLTIPLEKYFYEDELKPKRQSRWGDKQTRTRKKIHQDVVFNPLEALGQTQILSLTADPNAKSSLNAEQDKQQKRQSKFGPEYEKVFFPPFLHYAPNKLNLNEIEYVIRLYRLDEINKKLSSQAYLEPVDPDLRSPSPDPIYDNKGQRTNTRENRAKEYLQREKADIIEQCMKLKKIFVPPNDYKPLKKSKKIFIPESDWDNTNYIGLIIGPQGKTQKTLEKKCGCKISIRGKGANVKQSARYGQDSDEKLHIFLQADTDEKIELGAELIDKILKQDIVEEPQQDVKNMQIIQLKTITGLFIDFCENCHEKGHRAWQCPHQKKIKVKCDYCGEYSHPTSDCPFKAEIEAKKNAAKQITTEQKDFAKLLLELEGDNAKKLLELAGKSTEKEEIQLEKTSNVSFITDFNKNLLALTYGPVQEKKQSTMLSLASSLNELKDELFKDGEINNNIKIDDSLIAKQQAKFLTPVTDSSQMNAKDFSQTNINLNSITKIAPPPSLLNMMLFKDQNQLSSTSTSNSTQQQQQQPQISQPNQTIQPPKLQPQQKQPEISQQLNTKPNNPLLNPSFLTASQQPQKIPSNNPLTGLGLGIPGMNNLLAPQSQPLNPLLNKQNNFMNPLLQPPQQFNQNLFPTNSNPAYLPQNNPLFNPNCNNLFQNSNYFIIQNNYNKLNVVQQQQQLLSVNLQQQQQQFPFQQNLLNPQQLNINKQQQY